MINTEMKTYNYYTFGSDDEYGQQTLSTEVQGSIKMAIYSSSISVQDNIKYKDATYIGLTLAEVDDTFVIDLGNDRERLKVLYVNPQGRFKTVFLKEI